MLLPTDYRRPPEPQRSFALVLMLSKCCPQTPLSAVASLWWTCPLQKVCLEMPASMPLNQHSLFLIRVQYAKCSELMKDCFPVCQVTEKTLGKLGVQEQTGHFRRQLSATDWIPGIPPLFPPHFLSFLPVFFFFFLFLSFSLLCFYFPPFSVLFWIISKYPDFLLNTVPKSAIRACLRFCLWKTIFCCNVGYNLWMKWVSVPFWIYCMMSEACSGRREVACLLFRVLLRPPACVWDRKKSNRGQSFR